jgi:hypothetical protein
MASIEVGTFRGLDALVLRSAKAEAVVVPSLGRVMSFRRHGQQNLLFAPREAKDVGGWVNHGGDKLWFAPQSLWGWPPDPDLDQSPHSVEILWDRLILTSPVSRRWGLQLQREIWLDSATLHSLNRVINRSSRVMRVSAWQVAQVGNPRRALLELGAMGQWYDYKQGALIEGYHSIDGDALSLRPHPTASRKFGSAGSKALAQVQSGDVIALTSYLVPRTEYPDEGSAMQVFMGTKDSGYLELEAAGPLANVMPGLDNAFSTSLTAVERREGASGG